MEKSSQIAWKIVPLRHFFPLKVVPLIEVLLYSAWASNPPRSGKPGDLIESCPCAAFCWDGCPPMKSPVCLPEGVPGWLSGLACWCHSVVRILPIFSHDTCPTPPILLSCLVSDTRVSPCLLLLVPHPITLFPSEWAVSDPD
jgi:hypothetical protein